ncbi:hypothetical protein KM043_013365 [Ampulex compressa]|nr:hypothetical protein KM043_013365 [Ampulex compressa]
MGYGSRDKPMKQRSRQKEGGKQCIEDTRLEHSHAGIAMSGTNTVNSTRIELLTKHNYDTWKIQVEAILVKSDSWPHVSGDFSKPVVSDTGDTLVTSQAALNAWIIQDRNAKSDLILSIARNSSNTFEVARHRKKYGTN